MCIVEFKHDFNRPFVLYGKEKGIIGFLMIPFSRRNGWGTRVRTWVNGARTRRPTTRRSPNKFVSQIYMTRLRRYFFSVHIAAFYIEFSWSDTK